MIEIHPFVHVGSQHDYDFDVINRQNWRVVHACKEPYHRAALGYSGVAVHKAHPEYLIARRGHRLILNLIDADDPKYIPKTIVDAALDFIRQSVEEKMPVLVHCNQGCSRAPSIAFLYLTAHSDCFSGHTVETAIEKFKSLYPLFSPAKGMRGFIAVHYAEYLRPESR